MWEALGGFGIALIGFGSAYLKYLLDKRKLEAELKITTQEVEDLKIGISVTFEEVSKIQNTVLEIFKKTSADRFLILMATNGKKELRFTSVVFEQHQDGYTSLSFGATNKYIRFEFDSVYMKMLKDVEKEGCLYYDVDSMDDGDLKQIYVSENVKYSNVYFLNRMPIDSENDKMVYASIGKHGDKPFTPEELFKMRLSVNKIRNISKDFK